MFWWGLCVGAFIGWVLCSLWTPEPPDCHNCPLEKEVREMIDHAKKRWGWK